MHYSTTKMVDEDSNKLINYKPMYFILYVSIFICIYLVMNILNIYIFFGILILLFICMIFLRYIAQVINLRKKYDNINSKLELIHNYIFIITNNFFKN